MSIPSSPLSCKIYMIVQLLVIQGMKTPYNKLKRNFFFKKGMDANIKNYIKQCNIYQRAKMNNIKSSVLL